MANDRLFMQCKECKAEVMLAKYYPNNRGVWNSNEVIDFIDKHMECVGSPMVLPHRVFDLYTESQIGEKKNGN